MKYKYNEDLQEVFKSNKKPSLAIERPENNKKSPFEQDDLTGRNFKTPLSGKHCLIF